MYPCAVILFKTTEVVTAAFHRGEGSVEPVPCLDITPMTEIEVHLVTSPEVAYSKASIGDTATENVSYLLLLCVLYPGFGCANGFSLRSDIYVSYA